MHLHFRSFGLEWEVVSRIWHETYGFDGPVYDVCVRRVKVSGTKRPYGHFEPDPLAPAAEFEAEEVDVDSVDYYSDPKVVVNALPGRGSGLSYPVSSAPAPKKARGRDPDVVVVYDSDTSSKAASVATTRSEQSGRSTRSAQSGRAHGPAASAEDHCLGLDARRTEPTQFVHRSVAAATPAKPEKRSELHPPHPFIAKRQVRRSECSI